MSTTDNLGMTLIEGSDYITPDTINDNFEIVDALGKDYVKNCGTTSAGWWWRKWASGRMECGIDYYSFGNVAVELYMPKAKSSGVSTTNGLYQSTEILSFGSYPKSFSKNPFVVISPRNGTASDGNTKAMQAHIRPKSSTTTSPGFRLRFWSDSGTLLKTMKDFYAAIYVCGSY